MKREFESIDGFLFDLDGCIYEGDLPLPAARELLGILRAEDKKIAFISNNSTHSAEEIARKMEKLDIVTDQRDVFVPTDFAGSYLAEQFGIVSVFPIAGKSVIDSLSLYGHRFADEEACDVVLIARDTDFTYAKLERAARYIQGGAVLVATNADSFHPGNGGFRIPETGSLLASITTVSGETARIVGKPEPYLFRKCLERLGLDASRTAMIGDNVHTDIAGANKAGLRSVWINSLKSEAPESVVPWKEYGSLREFLQEFIE